MSAYFAVNRRMNVDQMTMGFSGRDLEVLRNTLPSDRLRFLQTYR
jgi:hypothetical protein